MTAKDTKNSLKDMLREMESIVENLEKQKEIDLEATITQVEKGNELLTKIKKHMAKLENTFTELKQ